jgi:MoxR-like ATPase
MNLVAIPAPSAPAEPSVVEAPLAEPSVIEPSVIEPSSARPPSARAAARAQLAAADRLIALTRAAETAPGSDPAVQALALAAAANLPVLLWGQPGIGKSSTLTELSRGLGLPLETVIASVHEPSDFSGLPIVGADPAVHGVAMAPPDWAVRLRRAGEGLLFLDELSSAPPAVQAALLRVVLERRVGSLALPEGVRIVAAANPAGSAADGWQLAAPLANRFVHLDWVHDPAVVVRGLRGTWPRVPLPLLDPASLAGAVARARAGVAAFLTARPDYVHRMPPNAAGRSGAWPSPRTWEMALRLLAFGYAADADPEAVALAVRGAVGDGAGFELLAFLEQHDLADPEAVLGDPLGCELPERGDLAHALLGAVVEAVRRRPTRDRWEAGWTLIARLVETVPVDLVVAPSMDLAALRQPTWPPPEQLDRLGALEEVLAWEE